jgi:hypothetical protein
MNRKRFRASFRAASARATVAYARHMSTFWALPGPLSAELPHSFRVLPPVMFFTHVQGLSANRLGHPEMDPFNLRNSGRSTKLMPAKNNEIRARPSKFAKLCAPEDSRDGSHRRIAQYMSQTRTKHSKAILPPRGTLGSKHCQ